VVHDPSVPETQTTFMATHFGAYSGLGVFQNPLRYHREHGGRHRFLDLAVFFERAGLARSCCWRRLPKAQRSLLDEAALSPMSRAEQLRTARQGTARLPARRFEKAQS